MNNKVLIVDDDVNLLASLRRRLGRRFTVTTAVSAEEGLTSLKEHGPFAVVVSDQRMDHMDGIQFLTEVKDRSPETMRMMLTGNVDLRVAIDAINEAGAYRFLTKPCSGEDLIGAVEEGVKQYWLNTAERHAA